MCCISLGAVIGFFKMSAPMEICCFEKDLFISLENYDKNLILKDKQKECLLEIYQGRDVVASLPTGYGKSVIYHLIPQLLRCKHKIDTRTPVNIVVVCPLNVIQEDQITSLASKGIKSCRLDVNCNARGNTADEYTVDFVCSVDIGEVEKGHFDIIHTHPEALFCTKQGANLLSNKKWISRVAAVVIDECHKVEEWSKEFRTAFEQLHTLKAYFPGIPFVALSGTLTRSQLKSTPDYLGLINPVIIQENPDRPNIFLDRRFKLPSISVVDAYEAIYIPECDQLHNDPDKYPVTLMYLPLEWCSEASNYCEQKFGGSESVDLKNCRYGVMFSRQDKTVLTTLTSDLKQTHPRIRLVFCTSSVGMGFNASSITRVIHGKPPRNLSDYFQQIGRCGRSGEDATAILYFNATDIASNLPGIQQDIVNYCRTDRCLRETLLDNYGFAKTNVSPSGCHCCCICKLQCECDDCLVSAVQNIS